MMTRDDFIHAHLTGSIVTLKTSGLRCLSVGVPPSPRPGIEMDPGLVQITFENKKKRIVKSVATFDQLVISEQIVTSAADGSRQLFGFVKS